MTLDMRSQDFQWVLERWKVAFSMIHQRYDGYPPGFRAMVEAEIWKDYNSHALTSATPSSSVVRRAITYCWRGHDTLGAKPPETDSLRGSLAKQDATLAALRGPREMVTRYSS